MKTTFPGKIILRFTIKFHNPIFWLFFSTVNLVRYRWFKLQHTLCSRKLFLSTHKWCWYRIILHSWMICVQTCFWYVVWDTNDTRVKDKNNKSLSDVAFIKWSIQILFHRIRMENIWTALVSRVTMFDRISRV